MGPGPRGRRAARARTYGGFIRKESTLGKVLIQTEQEDEKHNLFPGLWELLAWFISWSSW